MKIAILGSTGLLGNTVAKHFLSNTKYEVVCTHRNEKVKVKDDSVYFDALEPNFSFLDKCDYVINCIGIIKPFMKEDLTNNILCIK